ncbi:DUF7563 family protein [Haladaptatus salinisoli]|uniref:DUF7563 family protein n=1 Tax=Haladaptatus salinisoli TaxID=2884876 RepID=UPI003F5ED8F2
MRACGNCGQQVSTEYFRVFADNDGVLHRCQGCTSTTAMLRGAGAGVVAQEVDR